jgi:glucosamine--fructose-6-phosphate aminotransferase (isomerizing)
VGAGLRPEVEHGLLSALQELPAHLAAVQELGPQIEKCARGAPSRAAWAVVGSGLNRVAASEVRIKLSELCYRTVSTDALEDKKHIDLSAEAIILVCAAGAPPQQIRDMAKEVEIFAAHRNHPVVIVDDDIDISWATPEVIRVPRTHSALAWLLSTAVGHLFAYHAARAIDELGLPLRQALTLLEERVDAGASRLADVTGVTEPVEDFLVHVATGELNGVLSPEAALGLSNLLLLVRGGGASLPMPNDEIGGPIEYVRHQLTAGAEELTRSIDSVKHQAKTVTVGTSRGDSDLLGNSLTRALTDAGTDVALLTYPVLLAVRAYAPLIEEVSGAVRYRVEGSGESSTLRVVAKTGLAADLPSRADNGAPLTGSKRFAVDKRMIQLLRGKRDDRLVLLIPEQAGAQVSGLTLLHVRLADGADAPTLVAALEATGSRLAMISAGITEMDLAFDPAMLAKLPAETVLIGPVSEVVAALAR